MSWTVLRGLQGFDQYKHLWDEINHAQGNHILLDSKFVRPLIQHFGSSETALAVSSNRHESAGIALIDKNGKGFWQTFQPAQAPLGLVLLRKGEEIENQIHDLMQSLPGLTLGIGVLQQDPKHTMFKNLCNRRVEMLDYIQTASVVVNGSFEDYWKSRGQNLTHNLARQRRRLQDQGVKLKLMTYQSDKEVSKCISDYGMLEGAGWKGEHGTAVAAENRQGLFYRQIMEDFCAQGEGVIYQLLLNDQIIASDLCLRRNGTLIILKTAYNQNLKGLSPGLLMHEELFRRLFDDGAVREVEFYGRVRDWHRKWTDEIRTMYHLNFYRHSWVAPARRCLKWTRSLFGRSEPTI